MNVRISTGRLGENAYRENSGSSDRRFFTNPSLCETSNAPRWFVMRSWILKIAGAERNDVIGAYVPAKLLDFEK